MSSRVGVIPHFKGDVPPVKSPEQRVLNAAVITGMDPATGSLLERSQYLLALRIVAGTQRQVAENVARVFAMALEGLRLRDDEKEVQPFFLEGCRWDWGTDHPLMGAEVAGAMYHVVPEGMRSALPTPHMAAMTKRTRDEFEQVLQLADTYRLNEVTTVTHAYHRFRTSLVGNLYAERNEHAQELHVITPEQIAAERERRGDVQPGEQFLLDAIRIASPNVVTRLKEGLKEMGPLLGFHLIERLTGVDVEGAIVKGMAVRNEKRQ